MKGFKGGENVNFKEFLMVTGDRTNVFKMTVSIQEIGFQNLLTESTFDWNNV